MKVEQLIIFAAVCGLTVACQPEKPLTRPEREPETAFFPALEPSDNPTSETLTENPWLDGFGGQTHEVAASGASEENYGGAVWEGGSGSENEGDTDPTSPGEPSTDEESPKPKPAPQKPRLKLAEYKEGTGSDKRLALMNEGQGVEGSCSVLVYANGASEPWRTIAIPVLPEVTQSVVLCSDTETAAGCTQAMSGSTYNGDDALVVMCEGVITDSFGQVGVDPGNAWSEAGGQVSSKDGWLVRCSSPPDIDPLDEFLIAGSWLEIADTETPAEAALRCPSNVEGAAGASGF